MCPSKLSLKVALCMESPSKRIQEWMGTALPHVKTPSQE